MQLSPETQEVINHYRKGKVRLEIAALLGKSPQAVGRSLGKVDCWDELEHQLMQLVAYINSLRAVSKR